MNGSDAEVHHLSDYTGGVPFTESPILEMPEYKGSLAIAEESTPIVENRTSQAK